MTLPHHQANGSVQACLPGVRALPPHAGGDATSFSLSLCVSFERRELMKHLERGVAHLQYSTFRCHLR